ncbi:FAD/NAD(P)-binding domain-containing protein [Trichocladium antarcticum]|uniref:FAD/NAD(P)-binding domain-containing protein n=1 Tax=Trichocladium antarcticum TaxID=1450529 RepID=A0AAN6UCX0_9PEZI|nr:FAD/NAD(P)-binding domain-containing protein [Trichocladium antarcticum]
MATAGPTVASLQHGEHGEHDEQPRAADLRAMCRALPLPVVAAGTVDRDGIPDEVAAKLASDALDRLSAALAADDAQQLEGCFVEGQAYWKDQLALTCHLRTFTTPGVIAASLLATRKLRGLDAGLKLEGAHFKAPTPDLPFVDGRFSFKTASPAAACSGSLLLLPGKNNGTVGWKIWVLSTWMEELDVHPENEALLPSPGRQLDGLGSFETDVFIIGGGNAAITLAARLKAMGVDSVMAERNPSPGDNWALRYDSMRFHVPTSSAEMPFMYFGKEFWGPHRLNREELTRQVQRYVAAFHLNLITAATIQSTVHDASAKRWVVKFATPGGQRTAVAKHLVQATGYGVQKPYLPPMADEPLYTGTSVHSAHYKNAVALRETGAKSAIVIGSASTAFDILEDCHAAGLATTIAVRSHAFIVPVEHIFHPHAFGGYDLGAGVPANDRVFMTLPTWVDSQLAHSLLGQFAAQEPHRYAALAAAGFPFIDSTHPDGVLAHYLLVRAGGHYVDVGGTELIARGEVGVKAGVEPVGYTATGLRFADGSVVEADAVVWCTGFADRNARSTAAEILGSGAGAECEIADRLDATWGVDAEGEIRGMWKRHPRLDNYWSVGGHLQQQRWYSRLVALQIKAELEGILPPAYRETPGVRG